MPGRGAGRKRKCPCIECDGAGIDHRRWKKHADEIATGARKRSAPYGFGLGDDLDPGRAKSKWPPERESPADAPDLHPDSTRRGVHEKTVAAALEVVELVAQGTCTVTGAEAMLKVMARMFNVALDEQDEGAIPQSWYHAMKLGLDGKRPKFFFRDFCNGKSAGRKRHAEHLFPEDPRKTKCPTCRK